MRIQHRSSVNLYEKPLRQRTVRVRILRLQPRSGLLIIRQYGNLRYHRLSGKIRENLFAQRHLRPHNGRVEK